MNTSSLAPAFVLDEGETGPGDIPADEVSDSASRITKRMTGRSEFDLGEFT